MNKQIAPVIGQSVFIPFITGDISKQGEAEKIGYIKGGASLPFDTITAVYSETEYLPLRDGKQKVYSVQVKSGDAVKVIRKDEKWLAVS